MNQFTFICGFAVAVLWSAVAAAETPNEQANTVTIPLDQIWAIFMPGTQDLHTLEPEVFSSEASKLPPDVHAQRARESLINQIGAHLQPEPADKPGPAKKNPNPRPAFAVLGTGREALQAAAAVFAQGQKPQQSFPEGSEISVVFFSYQAGSRVQLVKVERENNVIQIRYRFFADGLTAATSHIALIPLGDLPVGKYQVEITQSPMSGTFKHSSTGQVMSDWGQKLICQPFSFFVEDRRDE